MLWLIAASLLWAFSFGLIKGYLVGLDPATVAAGRLLLAALAFLPWLLRARLQRRAALAAAALGAVQFGLMYVLYIASFQWLAAWKVALLTVFTPFFVIAAQDLGDRRLDRRGLVAAAIAVAGAVWVQAGTTNGSPGGWTFNEWPGILLLQGANLCFALGQVRFRPLVKRCGGNESGALAWMYVGAFFLAALAAIPHLDSVSAGWESRQVLVLLYLGLIPTALGFAFWNKGAARTGTAFLAAANDLKIPLAVLVSWLVFREAADPVRVLPGLVAVAVALWMVRGRAAR